MLMERETDVAELVKGVVKSTPKTGQEAVFKLSVFMRSGMNKEAIEALRELKALAPRLDNYQVSSIYYDACDNVRAWDVAKATVEVFADNVSEVALDNRLLKHFLNSGWTVEKVDQWLAGMPKGTRNFWVKECLRFSMRHGRGEALVRELSDSVRKNPKDIDGAVAFLDGLIYARHTGGEKWDLSWMGEAIEPGLATEAEQIASRLKTLNSWMTATTFYRQAIDMPLTDEEVRHLGMIRAAFVPPERLRAMFTAHAREGMAECLLKLDRKDQAQQWMVEAADIREKHNLGLNALFAGQVQAASGQRIIEDLIKEKEKKSEDDPQYWRERAQYYWGRNEPAQEEEALLRGLALTTPQPEPERRFRGPVDWRSWLLADYTRFLMREKRIGKAVELLRKEIKQAPATSESAKRAAHLLAFDFDKQIRVDDAVLWNWLSNRPKWGYTEERLLWRILESAKGDDLDKHFIRAEEFALGKDPSRTYTIGWIMNRKRFPKRSIPLLKYAAGNADDKELKGRAVFTLFESYLDTGDWRHAEAVFPGAALRLTPKELPEWYSRVAVAAAKAGAKADAMRIWSRVANLSPSTMGGLEDLVRSGLRKELTNFYREMQEKMPSSTIPAKVLKSFEEK
jgi:tetratricopeptide (TPR) repeat protein